MKTERNILFAFVLNFAFSVFEFLGGIFTGSVAILSDAVHDVGDAMSIGVAYFLERKSKRGADERYTYGYSRYSVMGSVITTLILLFGSAIVICNAVWRILRPTVIDYNGMIIFAVVGVLVNFGAALLTREGGSLNQRAVNLHMLEDVLGWVVVLVGAIVMKFTDFYLIDPLMSIGVAIFILINALKNLKEALDLFLEKAPNDVSIPELREHVCQIEGVIDVHHVHVWSMDGQTGYATMHVVTGGEHRGIKSRIREKLAEHGIGHVTLELEAEGEHCHEERCRAECSSPSAHHCHHGHHHHHHNHHHNHHHHHHH